MSAAPKSIHSRQSKRSSYYTASKRDEDTSSSVFHVDEDDEWTAIQKFNQLLHYEEQKQAAAREAERKRLLCEELAKQKELKEAKRKALIEEDKAYHR